MPSAFDGYSPRERVKTKVQCDYCKGDCTIGPASTPDGVQLDQPCPKCHGCGYKIVET